MKISLVQPNYRKSRESGAWLTNPPLGLCYLAAVLEEHDYSCEIFDANVKDWSPAETARQVSGSEVVGVSLLTPGEKWSLEFVKLLPETVLKVCGGPHPTALPEKMLKQGFDIAVRSEGEFSFLELVQGKAWEEIQGISFKRNGKLRHTPPREHLDPNQLPLPARHLLESNGVDKPYLSAGTQYTPWSPILSSRGCPYKCNYCCKEIFGYEFRPRTPEHVFEEIKFLVEEYGVKELAIYDDIFNIDMKRANKILDLILESDLKLHLRTTNGIRVNGVTEDFMRKMRDAGCEYVAFGIEAGNQEVLNKIPKGITLDQVRTAVRAAQAAKIPIVSGFFMFGLFGDTAETMQETIDFAKELELDVALFNISTPYPGTRMFEKIKKEGEFLFDTNNWEDIQHTSGKMHFTHPEVAPPEVVEEYYAKAHREFYLRPTYMLRQALKLRSWQQAKTMTNAGLAFLKAMLRRPGGE